jgi:hypothetical protein
MYVFLSYRIIPIQVLRTIYFISDCYKISPMNFSLEVVFMFIGKKLVKLSLCLTN